ncbi:Bug family tripartite tricarboxylate transporter substrate binding protein [Phreatobacter sp. AB_2022a]|uniref:Bug family tripartite tricarboxylate transporter substrate binding protein n=1 Tax=Phreatobacter sp. AB_2022a TaxID=3003134 RepID=UPI0022871776|nr:tripartite tricarboxylate transporter substrate binding protein [Phreatobacter sp. AB_2022a]MCZ0735217.1 tripartite tricarboxylate transporter substrate binding protein [Phreatobacter sp. AB_2022a]
MASTALLAAAFATGLAPGPAAAQAAAPSQAWPNRAVRLIVPYAAGGNVDVAARILAEKLQQELGQPFVIENKPGAGGLIGSETVARAEPDGYTLLIGANGPILFAPEMGTRRAYEWRRDFIPVSTVTLTPLVLQVHPDLPAKSMAEFLALARTRQPPLTMASPGPGTTNHLMSELMQSKLGVTWMTVQYRGNAPATNDLVGGHVQFNLDQLSVALPFLKDNRTRALAVTGPQRLAELPDVPTFTELGYGEIDGQTFTGLMAPAATPEPVIRRLHETVIRILNDAQVKARFAELGAQSAPMSRDAFRAYLEREDQTWIPLIRRLDIRSQ